MAQSTPLTPEREVRRGTTCDAVAQRGNGEGVSRLLPAAALVLFLVGCGSRSEFTVPTTPTIPSTRVRSGDTVICRNGSVAARAKVPSRGVGEDVVVDGAQSSAEISLTRRADGSLVVVCND